MDYDIVAEIIDEELKQPHVLWDMNYLYDAFKKSMEDSSWKSQPQKFELNILPELAKLSKSLEDHTYITDPTIEFTLNERGKTRYIHGNTIKDRIVRHNLCDNIITPTIAKFLIENNPASQKGKGITFARKQFEKHLHNFWLKNRHNQGYILFIDFSKFYDNIPHKQLREVFSKLLDDEAYWLFNQIIDSFNIDITQYPTINPEDKFDSIEFHNLVAEELKGLPIRYLNKGIDIGDQTSQNIGIFYPTRIDTYATIVKGHKWYGRYMDDIYIIHESKEYLVETLKGFKKSVKITDYLLTKRRHISVDYPILLSIYKSNIS